MEDNIDLLLTDVVMPGGVNGRQLADEATRRRPTLRVLFMTGYTRNAIVHHGRLDAGIHMIGKPFSFQELAARVRARLDLTSPDPARR
jgi:DNA-binding response OmpR family regulator